QPETSAAIAQLDREDVRHPDGDQLFDEAIGAARQSFGRREAEDAVRAFVVTRRRREEVRLLLYRHQVEWEGNVARGNMEDVSVDLALPGRLKRWDSIGARGGSLQIGRSRTCLVELPPSARA